MSYPYPHRNRPQGDPVEIHKLGEDAGGGTAFTAALTTTGVVQTINLPYNAWRCGGAFWATNNDAALTIKVRPWVDHAHTVLGNALAMTEPGSAAAVTGLSIAAQTETAGVVFEVISATGALAYLQPGHNIFVHGLQVAVTAVTALTNTDGTYDWEFVAVPEV